MFHYFDTDGDGALSADQAVRIFGLVGFDSTDRMTMWSYHKTAMIISFSYSGSSLAIYGCAVDSLAFTSIQTTSET
jgi:hypothetical protein